MKLLVDTHFCIVSLLVTYFLLLGKAIFWFHTQLMDGSIYLDGTIADGAKLTVIRWVWVKFWKPVPFHRFSGSPFKQPFWYISSIVCFVCMRYSNPFCPAKSDKGAIQLTSTECWDTHTRVHIYIYYIYIYYMHRHIYIHDGYIPLVAVNYIQNTLSIINHQSSIINYVYLQFCEFHHHHHHGWFPICWALDADHVTGVSRGSVRSAAWTSVWGVTW